MSREAELYKDKIEVSLDGRQIFYLFFGGAVIVGLVFVLGVMVGRRVEARGHVDRARVAASIDPLAALDRLEGGSGLSFQGSLRGEAAPASDVEKTIAAMKKDDKKADAKVDAKKDAKVEAPKIDAKVDDAKVADKKPVDAAKVDSKVDDAKVFDKKPVDAAKLDAKKVDAKFDDAKVGDKKSADAAKDDKKVEAKKVDDKKVDAKIEPEKKADADKKLESAKPESDKKVEAEKKPKFTLQLSSFQDKSEAQAYLDSIKTAGFQAYVTEGAVDGKQYFRVRMGSYRTMDAANEAKAELEKATKKSAIVTKL